MRLFHIDPQADVWRADGATLKDIWIDRDYLVDVSLTPFQRLAHAFFETAML